METPRPLPRPPAVTFVAVLLIAAALWALVFGMYELNLGRYETKQTDLLLFVVLGPVIAATCGFFLLRGKNWARFAFWLLFGFIVYRYLLRPKLEIEQYLAVLLYVYGAIMIARPNAHWFFTGRDYTRRERSVLKRRRMVHVPMAKAGRASDYKY